MKEKERGKPKLETRKQLTVVLILYLKKTYMLQQKKQGNRMRMRSNDRVKVSSKRGQLSDDINKRNEVTTRLIHSIKTNFSM